MKELMPGEIEGEMGSDKAKNAISLDDNSRWKRIHENLSWTYY